MQSSEACEVRVAVLAARANSAARPQGIARFLGDAAKNAYVRKRGSTTRAA